MVRPRLVCLILALVTLLVYGPVRHFGFVVYDDPDYVTENSQVQAGITAGGIKWAFTTWHASNWHPLTWLSHMLDCELFGLDPGPHHLVSVLIHTANGVLLFLLLLRWTGALWPAAIAAAWFAWHPLHVESVAWVSERKDVLCAFFGLLTLWAYTSYVKSEGGAGEERRFALRYYVVAVLLFALGLMTKPMLVTLPFALLLLDYWPLRRCDLGRHGTGQKKKSLGRLAVEKWPFFLLTVISCILTYLAQREVAVVNFEHLPLGPRLANAALSYMEYLAKTIWPVNLAVIYPQLTHLPALWVAGAVILLAAISWLVWRTRLRFPYLLVGWFWYLGTLVPVIGIVQVGGQALADRYLYLPSVGVFVAVAWGVNDLVAKFRLGRVATAMAAGLSLAGCLAITAHQLPYWRDSQSLFAHTVAVTKENAIAEINLGVALEQQGLLEQALVHYREAVRINPGRAQVHNNLGGILDAQGQPEAAVAEYREAVRLLPNAPLAHANLGAQLAKTGNFDEGMRELAAAVRLSPDDSRPHYLMGKACLRAGRDAEAVGHFRDALSRNENDLQSLVYLARVLAGDEDAGVRNPSQAVALAERANALTGGEQPYILDTLALAYANASRFHEARQTVEAAIQIVQAARDAETLAGLQARLRLYEANQPARENFKNAVPEPGLKTSRQ